MPDIETVIKGLEICKEDSKLCFGESECGYQSCFPRCWITLARDALELLKAQDAFVKYFAGLYGRGLGVTNWHLNGATEPFDSFYDSAMEEYENARCE